jgi:ribonucleoside-diphosphate reductase alpha chain
MLDNQRKTRTEKEDRQEEMREEVTTFNSVKNQTTEEYFGDNQFAIDAFKKKYTLHENETYVQAVKRVCDYIASAEETPELQKYWSARWFDEIYNDWWHPAGSIMQGSASGKKISLSNCTTISMGVGRPEEEWDNLESIIKNTTFTAAKTAAYRQGLGIDFSRLRPDRATVQNSANESSGVIHWMKLIDSIGYYVGQKGRIPAMLFSLNCSHPDVEAFIKVKADHLKIQNANISVQCTEAFYKAVEKDKPWELRFEIPEVKKGQRVYIDVHSIDKDCQYDTEIKSWYYIARKHRKSEKIIKTVSARELLALIAKQMCEHGEPGIQNIDIARKYSNSDYVYNPDDEYDSRIIGTNACSEQYLSRDSLCVLSSSNVGKFSPDPIEYEPQVAKVAESITRFLDNVNTMEVRDGTYATPFQRIAIEKLRRIGAGFTNIAGWLFKNDLEYGSPPANEAIAEFTSKFNYYLYKTSIALGKEKGSFGLFDRKKFEESPFVQRMIKLGLEFEAMRNVTCSSIAPTGTLSLMFRDLVLGYGIEPAFAMCFWKRTRIAGHYDYYFCVPAAVHEVFTKHGVKIPMDGCSLKDTWDGKYGKSIADFINKKAAELQIHFKSSTDIDSMAKLDLMAQIMKSIDSSISVTYMLPEDADWENVYNFILAAHDKEVKSIAAFPDRKMYGIIAFMPFKDLAIKLIKDGVEIQDQNFSDKEKVDLEKTIGGLSATSVTEGRIQKTIAPKRPKSLPCDIHHIKLTKKLDKVRTFDYLVLVGMLGGDPYEVFVMENGFVDKKIIKGVVTKVKSGVYGLKLENGTEVNDITHDTSPEEDVCTRLTSASLRHGTDVAYIVDQLEKSEGDLYTFGKAMARALKKYVKDGVKGGDCLVCGGKLIRENGCKTCINCGDRKCD